MPHAVLSWRAVRQAVVQHQAMWLSAARVELPYRTALRLRLALHGVCMVCVCLSQ